MREEEAGCGARILLYHGEGQNAVNELLPNLTRQLWDQPETGPDLHIAQVRLANGRTFSDVAIVRCAMVVAVRGYPFVPFDAQDVVDLKVTNRRWGFAVQARPR